MHIQYYVMLYMQSGRLVRAVLMDMLLVIILESYIKESKKMEDAAEKERRDAHSDLKREHAYESDDDEPRALANTPASTRTSAAAAGGTFEMEGDAESGIDVFEMESEGLDMNTKPSYVWSNPLRSVSMQAVQHKAFDNVMLAVILVNCLQVRGSCTLSCLHVSLSPPSTCHSLVLTVIRYS